VQLNVCITQAQVKLNYTPGKGMLHVKIPSGGTKTEAGKKNTEATETKLKFAENYFGQRVKFLLNWKYGTNVCETGFKNI
jgi:hypothetical protein